MEPNRIAHWRNVRGIKVADLIAEAGISKSYYDKLVGNSGEGKEAADDVLFRLAKALKVKPWELLNAEDPRVRKLRVLWLMSVVPPEAFDHYIASLEALVESSKQDK